MTTIPRQALLDLGAEEILLGGNQYIRLDQEPNVWLVEEGKVEIFAIHTEVEKQGPRTHVTTIEAGRVLFGIHSRRKTIGASFLKRSKEERKTALMAIGSPDTRLLKAPIQALIELAREEEHAEAIQTTIEEWISDLFVKVSRTPAPNRFEPLSPGDELTLEPEETSRSKKGVVWVRHLTGESHFLGRPELVMKQAAFLLPVSDQTWLVSTQETTLSCVATEKLVRGGTVWEGLARFHDLFLEYVNLLVQADRAVEAKRLRRRRELDQGTLGSASEALASVLSDGGTFEQPDEASSGPTKPLLAAARLVGDVLGMKIEEPRDRRPEANHGHGMERIASISRVAYRLVILRDRWWRRDNGPLLAFISALDEEGEPDPKKRLTGDPVALLPVSPRRYEMVNPATGERTAVNEDVAATLEGEAFMFYAPLPERAVGISDLVNLAVRGRGRDLATMALMGAATGMLALLVPILSGHIFGTLIPAAERERLVQMTLALGAAALATFGFRLTRAIALLRISGKLDGTIQAAVWHRLLSLPVVFFRRYTTGDLVNRSMGIDQIRNLLLGNVASSLLDFIFSFFSLALLFYYSWQLALVAIGMIAILLTATGLLVWLQVRHQRFLLAMQGTLASLVFGLLDGIQKLRGAGAEARAFSLWAAQFGKMRELTLKVRRLANLQAAFNASYSTLTLMALFAAMYFMPDIKLSVSDFLAFSAAFGQFQAASLALISLLSGVLTMVPIYERLTPLLKTVPEVDEGKTDAGDLSGDLELSHVSFRYDENGPLILNDVTIRAKPGEFIALVGPSGSGKSTSLRLILGFEKPEAGSIYFDGQDLPSLDSQSVRRQMGVVMQNGKPMTGDIFQNIVGTTNLGMDEAWEGARMAGLEEDIKALPMGMHTVISEGGGGFSGGQVQRLMIARAVVHRPRILLFDEATSALDNRTQEIVSRSLEGLKATRIVVAHRLSTIRNADRIYVLEKGRVTEVGNYDELMEMGGTFASLAARQIA